MKAKLKTTFESHGRYVVGHVEDAEMYEKVKKGTSKWDETAYPRITHIRIPKEVFERLVELDARVVDFATRAELETLREFKAYFDDLYGKGLEVANFHENGELEPFDNFYESALAVVSDKFKEAPHG